MEDTISKKIVIISFAQGLKSKNNPDFTFDICDYVVRKEGKDKDGNAFVTYDKKSGIGTIEISSSVNVELLKFGAVCVGEFGEVYDRNVKANVLGLVGISKLIAASPMDLEKAFAKN